MNDAHSICETIKALYSGAQDIPACGYCDADSELTEIAPGVLHLAIMHDDDCPELARHTDQGN